MIQLTPQVQMKNEFNGIHLAGAVFVEFDRAPSMWVPVPIVLAAKNRKEEVAHGDLDERVNRDGNPSVGLESNGRWELEDDVL